MARGSGISDSRYNRDKRTVIINLYAKKNAFTVEDHSIIGGLGSAVSEYLCTLKDKPPLLAIGIQDEYGPSGDYKWLLEKRQLMPEQIAKRIVNEMKNCGILINRLGKHYNTLKILFP